MKKKLFSLRLAISFTIISLIIIISISLIVISFIGSRDSVYYLTNNMMSEISKSIKDKTIKLFDTAEKTNQMLTNLITNNTLDLNNQPAILNMLKNIIIMNEDFSSIDLAVPAGHKYQARKMDDESISTRINYRAENGVQTTWFHDNPNLNLTIKDSLEDFKTGYDPRTRPWYIKAEKAGKPTWTDVYVSGTANSPSRELVSSNANPVYDSNKKLIAVTAIDITVTRLSLFLSTLKILKNGKAFIFNEKNQIIAFPINNKLEINKLVKEITVKNRKEFALVELEEFPDENIKTALISYSGKQNSPNDTSTIIFTNRTGEKFLASFISLPGNSQIDLHIGIIAPEKDIMEKIDKNNQIIICLSILFLSIALIIGFILARAISKSLTILSGEVDKIKEMKLDSEVKINSNLIEVDKISNSVENMKKGLRSFKKYVPSDLVLQLIKLQKEAVIEGERKELTLLFTDIAGFTTISERLSPEQLVENLGVYFSGMSSVILKNHGTIDKYIGDAIMAFWGAPNYFSDHPKKACLSALQCQAFLNEVAKEWFPLGKPIFETRFGLHTGEVIVGNMGYEERMNYTVLGDGVNLASRLESLNKYYGTNIMLSEETFNHVKNDLLARKLDVVAVKGKTKGISIFELICEKNEADEKLLKFVELFNEGIDLYLSRKWQAAQKNFKETLSMKNNSDVPSTMLLERCKEFIAAPPAQDWNGVYIFNKK